MTGLRFIIRWGYAPFLLLGLNGVAIGWLGLGGSPWLLLPLLLGAIGVSFVAEVLLPYESDWNRSRGDVGRDVIHAIVNEMANAVSIAAAPVAAGLIAVQGAWPHAWPFWVQVVGALVVLDGGITLAHWSSHRWQGLWRFHAVHHSVERMYGLNGLMKHPLHQAVEMIAGATPLVVLGMPSSVGWTIGFCTAIQLLLQHSNVDYALGPLTPWIAGNRVHRFHHLRWPGEGDVNFGLFTTLWDRLLGTARYDEGRRFRSADLGIGDRISYPRSYGAQLIEPFRTVDRPAA